MTRIELEAKERELSGKLRAFERETSIMQKEIETMRGSNKELDSLRFGNEKTLAEYRVRLEGLEAQVRNKEDVIAKQADLIENGSRQKVNLFTNAY